MKILFALLSGLIFGIGLILSGMANPAKVIGFLDLFGKWDPSLAIVMAGAVCVCFFAFRFAKKRTLSFLGEKLDLPKDKPVSRKLFLGSLVFGVGWGLAGFCPGPGLVAMGMGYEKGAIFVLSMLVGMFIFEVIVSKKVIK